MEWLIIHFKEEETRLMQFKPLAQLARQERGQD